MEITNTRELGPDELYERRKQAVVLYKKGMTRMEIAPLVGAHRNTVGAGLKPSPTARRICAFAFQNVMRRPKITALAAVFLLLGAVSPALSGLLNHYPLTAIYKKYRDPRSGLIDYRGLKNNPLLLRRYRAILGNITAGVMKELEPDEKKALWINAFNAGVLAQVLRYYVSPERSGGFSPLPPFFLPPRSVSRADGFWTEKAIAVSKKAYSLEEIEYDILRKEYPDPRLPFILHRAARGAPAPREAVIASRLEKILDRQARRFIRDETRVLLHPTRKILFVPERMRWFSGILNEKYGGDSHLAEYDKSVRGIVGEVCAYSTKSVVNRLERERHRVVFISFDWSLDEKNVKARPVSPPKAPIERGPTVRSTPPPTSRR